MLTHHNAPRLHASPPSFAVGSAPPPPLQDARVSYNGQHVAVVVAETLEQATFAATLVTIDYTEETPLLELDDPRAQVSADAFPDVVRGEPDTALATSEVRVDSTYTTPMQHHNPMALTATTAYWTGNVLTLHDTTQGTHNTRNTLAAMLGLEISQVRVLAPFVGGVFGNRSTPCRATCQAGSDA